MNAMTPDNTIEPDHTAVVELARQRRDRNKAISDYYVSRGQATLSAIELAVGDVDSTGRPATDAELAVVARALIGEAVVARALIGDLR